MELSHAEHSMYSELTKERPSWSAELDMVTLQAAHRRWALARRMGKHGKLACWATILRSAVIIICWGGKLLWSGVSTCNYITTSSHPPPLPPTSSPSTSSSTFLWPSFSSSSTFLWPLMAKMTLHWIDSRLLHLPHTLYLSFLLHRIFGSFDLLFSIWKILHLTEIFHRRCPWRPWQISGMIYHSCHIYHQTQLYSVTCSPCSPQSPVPISPDTVTVSAFNHLVTSNWQIQIHIQRLREGQN